MTWQPAVFSRRSIFDQPFAEAFLTHLKAIEPMVDQVVERKRHRFQFLFNERMERPGVDSLLRDCRMSQEEVARLREPLLTRLRVGRRIGILNDPG